MTTTKTTVTAKDVQELRQRTGAGMMDSKRALEEANGDMDRAVRSAPEEWRRQGGEARGQGSA